MVSVAEVVTSLPESVRPLSGTTHITIAVPFQTVHQKHWFTRPRLYASPEQHLRKDQFSIKTWSLVRIEASG
jgi:hypothetical protein